MFVVRGDGEKFLAHRNAGGDGFRAEALGGFFKAAGDARGDAGEDAIGEAGLDVRLENYGRNAVQARDQDHRAGGVAADAERRAEFVAAIIFSESHRPAGSMRGVFAAISRRPCL